MKGRAMKLAALTPPRFSGRDFHSSQTLSDIRQGLSWFIQTSIMATGTVLNYPKAGVLDEPYQLSPLSGVAMRARQAT
jgi:hypothetical protein